MTDTAIPTTYDALLALFTAQQSQLSQLQEFVDSLLEQIRLSRHQHFGARSEKFSVDQLSLLEDLAEQLQTDNPDVSPIQGDAEDTVAVPAHRRKKGGRERLPDHLPRIDEVHTLEGESCQCPHCQQSMSEISERISEQLDIVPAQVQVIRRVRKVYGCDRCEGSIKTAPVPPQIIPKSNATAGTLAHIVTAKYVDSLPLYRQERQLQRIGIDIPRSTMAQWLIKAGDAVQPLINCLNDQVIEHNYIGMDETTIQVLREPNRKPQSKSYLWVRRGGPPDKPVILYNYSPTRSQGVPLELLEGFAGYLQVDGYEGYNAVCVQNQLTRVGCLAHVRRKFDEALKSQRAPDPNSLAGIALTQIRALYRIERELTDLEDEERQRERAARSEPLLADFREWLNGHLPLVPRQSALGKALRYTDRQWPTLITYLEDGQLRIDNNLTENAVRPFVVGRKNFLFCDSVKGAHATANLYGLIESARANQLEPYRYLREVFTELPKAQSIEDVERLLPWTIGR